MTKKISSQVTARQQWRKQERHKRIREHVQEKSLPDIEKRAQQKLAGYAARCDYSAYHSSFKVRAFKKGLVYRYEKAHGH